MPARDEATLESALAGSQQKWRYAKKAFLAIVTFLGTNGYDCGASDSDVIGEMFALADGRVLEEELADWIRKQSVKRK